MTYAPRPQGLDRLLPQRPFLIGMVHLLPLPGAPRWTGSMEPVLDRARTDARALASGGMDAVLVENFLDVPFHGAEVPPETVAAMACAVAAVVAEVSIPVGVNVLRNDARAALAVAAATGARFIRVNVHTGMMITDQGTLEGRAADTVRQRAALGVDVAILADVLVKHATPPAGLDPAAAARDTWHRGLADGLVVSGSGTGVATDPERVRGVKEAVPDAPVLVGSGVTAGSVAGLLAVADGAIVGSALTRDGHAGSGVDQDAVARLVEGLNRAR